MKNKKLYIYKDDEKEFQETNVTTEDYINMQNEISRLNNIINELNCKIKELDDMFYETFRISQNGYYSISEWELKDFTNKLKELKGE